LSIMRFLTITIIYFISLNIFSQKLNTQYFFIDKNDTLVKEQLATKKNKYQGYEIINENKIIKKYLRSSKIDGDDIKADAFESILFTFNKDNDTIVNEAYLKKINIIRTRKEFLSINSKFDETKNKFIFIVPTKCNNYILRTVRPLITE